MSHLASSLGIQPVGRFVKHEELPRHQQRAGDGQPLPHAEGIGTVALAGGRQQAHPIQRNVDALRRRSRIGETVRRVQPEQIGPA